MMVFLEVETSSLWLLHSGWRGYENELLCLGTDGGVVEGNDVPTVRMMETASYREVATAPSYRIATRAPSSRFTARTLSRHATPATATSRTATQGASSRAARRRRPVSRGERRAGVQGSGDGAVQGCGDGEIALPGQLPFSPDVAMTLGAVSRCALCQMRDKFRPLM